MEYFLDKIVKDITVATAKSGNEIGDIFSALHRDLHGLLYSEGPPILRGFIENQGVKTLGQPTS
jgi:hypothetical protein